MSKAFSFLPTTDEGLMHYTRPAREERYPFFTTLKNEKSMRQIAREINSYVSTVSWELPRNKSLRGYKLPAGGKEKPGKAKPKGKTRISSQTWLGVTQMLHLDVSLE